MKRILCVFLLFLLFTSCKVKNYTPELPSAFELNATVVSGDFSYTCKICRNESAVTVIPSSTAAKGMLMSYDGSSLMLEYDDFSYSLDGEKLEPENAAIVVFEAFEYIETVEELNVKKLENGYKYEGRISAGDFILLQNDDNSLTSLSLKSGDMSVEFEHTAVN